jgi:DNA-binding NtrC family response regulator
MKKTILIPENRQFFQLVANIPATNPFSPGRATIDEEISGIHKAQGRHQRVLYAAEAIRKRFAKLDVGGIRQFQDFEGHDCELMRYAFLFDVYQSCSGLFDAFIDEQEKAGASPVKVQFASKAINTLLQRGFTEKEATHYFALFYQIRRAFHFIDRGFVGRSDCMRELRMGLWDNIFTCDVGGYERYMWDKMEDFSTLLEGPTGCGKGAAAAAIGRSGFIPFDTTKQTFIASFTATFIPLNLSQFAEGLLESELFGHTKGAFTGAVESHEGVLSLCPPHGSIFLDEIGEISIPAQVKLLRVLEERIFSPVGSHEKLRFHGRVIAATNQPIDALRTKGTFRNDFYYRLCSDCIQVPPLAQRVKENPEELAELVEHFTALITGSVEKNIVDRVLDVIGKRLGPDYPWPGNVRELAQCIRRVILKQNYEKDRSCRKEPGGMEVEEITAQELLGRHCSALYERYGNYEKVARITALDSRTVKKHIETNLT